MIEGRWAVVAAGVLWSMGGVFIKWFDLPALTIACYRSLFAGLVLVPWVLQDREPFSGRAVWAALALYPLLLGSFVVATKATTSANAIALQYTAPLMVMVWAAMFLGERLTRGNVVGVALASVGVGVIVYGGSGTPDMRGIVVALASGVVFSWLMIVQQLMRGVSPIKFVCVSNLVAAVAMAPFVAGQWAVSGAQLAGLAVMGSVQIAAPYVLFTRGMRTVSAQDASLLTLVEPVLNPIWVYAIVGESPLPTTVIGGVLILAGLAGRFLL